MEVVLYLNDEETERNVCNILDKVQAMNGETITYKVFYSKEAMTFNYDQDISIVSIVIIDMDSESAFEVAKNIREKGYDNSLILISKNAQNVIKGYRVNACNYVLKKNKKILFNAINNAFIHEKRKNSKKVLIMGVGGNMSIYISDIYYFEANRRKVYVNYNEKDRFEFTSSISELENLLGEYGFVRCHKGYVVNIFRVAKYTSRYLILFDGTEIPIGRYYKDHIKTMLENVIDIKKNKNSTIIIE